MTNTLKKWVDFDYERYLEDDEVFYRGDGRLFTGEIFISKFNRLVIDSNTIYSAYALNGRYSESEHPKDIVMKPKTTKIFVSVNQFSPDCWEFSTGFSSKDNLLTYLETEIAPGWVKDSRIIEIEIEG